MDPLNVRHRRNATSLGERDRSAFGELLRGFRLRSGLSQEQLAERASMSAIAISALERGVRRVPYRSTVALLAEALDLSKLDRSLLETAIDRPTSATPGAWHDAAAANIALHNLPVALSSFLGRRSQLAAVATLLENNRLVTLTGSGGVGKTRAALQVGTTLAETLFDGAWLIDLTPLGNANLVTTTVAHALRIEERPDRPLLDTLIGALTERKVLLILDNCEHVIAEAARVALALLGHCPHLRILATSRDPLRIAGEQTYRLPSMNVPSAAQARTLLAAGAAEFDALTLFTQRGRGADHRFELTDANAPFIAEICRRLDGIPLAIELAAARVGMLPVERIAENLDRRFDLLTGGKRDSPARHQTMRALIDWSFDLLSEDEQLVFVRLSIFTDGCTLPLATSVCSGDGIEEANVFALLASLVEKSLLIADLTERAPRYRMLESFRAYGREKLRLSGAESTLAGRHAMALLELAKELWPAYDSETDAAFRTAARAEIDNWRAALEWSLNSRCAVTLGQHLVGNLTTLWYEFLPTEGRRWVNIAREASDAQTEQSALALLDLVESGCAARVGDLAVALSAAERAVSGLAGVHVARPAVWAQCARLVIMVRMGRASEAEPMLQEGLRTAQSRKATRLVGSFQVALAQVRLLEGDSVAARAHLSEAHAAYTDLQDARDIAMVMSVLSELEFIAGDPQTALRVMNDSISVAETLDDAIFSISRIMTKTTYLIALGRYDEARSIAREALTVSKYRQQPSCVASALSTLASIAALSPARARADRSMQVARVARVFGFADSYYFVSCQGKREMVEQKVYDNIYSTLRSAMPEAELRHHMTLGAQQTEDEAIREALSM